MRLKDVMEIIPRRDQTEGCYQTVRILARETDDCSHTLYGHVPRNNDTQNSDSYQ